MNQLRLFDDHGDTSVIHAHCAVSTSRTSVRLKSFIGPGWHTIALNAKTCDCAEFRASERRCRHLMALGIHRVGPFIAKVHPTFSQALSALVKALRIRRVEDAVYWLLYLD